MMYGDRRFASSFNRATNPRLPDSAVEEPTPLNPQSTSSGWQAKWYYIDVVEHDVGAVGEPR
jgi:hypothetical protein